MLDINEQSHTSTILNSLDKIYNQARIKGKFKSINLYILNIIFEFLNNESIVLTECQKKELNDLYLKIYFNSENICNTFEIKKCFVQSPTPFVQEPSTSCDNYEQFDNIYYWQVPDYDDDNDYPELIAETGYFDNILFDSKNNFITGVNCNFTEIGKIFIAVLNSNQTDNYRIFDVLNNDVTHTFTKLYSDPINTILFISDNVYSHSIMNLKVKIVPGNTPPDYGIFNNVFNNIFN